MAKRGSIIYTNLIFNRFLNLCGAANQKKKVKKINF